jgi:L-asparagine oxygenase
MPSERWEQLHADGYVLLSTSNTDNMLRLANELGVPVPSRPGHPVLAELKPEPFHKARTSSMTSRFGLHSFPLHTDGAFYPIPPRFVILRCERDSVGGRPTIILDSHTFLTDGLRDQLRTHLWQVHVRPAFYCSLLQEAEGSLCLRWDPNILRPAHRSAKSTTNDFHNALATSSAISINWEPTLTLVMDNWRLLHARADRPEGVDHEDRLLQRVLVAMP